MKNFFKKLVIPLKTIAMGAGAAALSAVVDQATANPIGLMTDPKTHAKQLGMTALLVGLAYLKQSALKGANNQPTVFRSFTNERGPGTLPEKETK